MPIESTKVKLLFKCQNLVNKDMFSKSDPMLFVDIMDGRTGVFERLGETELQKNNLNPEFKKEIELNYVFEKKQHLRVTILDVDDPDNVPKEYTANMPEADLLGRTEVTVAEIMGGRNWTVTKKLTGRIQNKDYGTVTVMGLKLEDSVRSEDILAFKLNGIELAAKDHNVFSADNSDPYFSITRLLPNEKKLCTSEVIQKSLNPQWKEQRILLSELCGGDLKRKIRINVYDEDTLSDPDPIGLAEFPVESLVSKERINLIDYKVPPRNIKAGFVQAREAAIYRSPTFMDYLAEGLDVELVFAIDFTKSNGDPMDPRHSLHCRSESLGGLTAEDATLGTKVVRGPNWKWQDQDGGAGCLGEVVGPAVDNWVTVRWFDNGLSNSYRCGVDGEYDLAKHCTNRYQKAMTGVASILMDFSKEKHIHALGFGGMVGGKPSFAFPLSENGITVNGVKGLLDAYDQAVTRVGFGEAGTMMAEVVNRVVSLARETVPSHPQKYYVLVILSDGDVDDKADTVDAIVAASELPISIITAGLTAPGHDEEIYTAWKDIDVGANELKDKNDKMLKRDTVNFIQIDEVVKKSDELAETILFEFKQQLVQYFIHQNVRPTIWQSDSVHNYQILENMPKVA